MRKITVLSIAIAFLFAGNASLGMSNVKNTEPSKTKAEKKLALPDVANNPSLISIGKDFDFKKGKLVEGYAIIHRKDKKVRPDKLGKPDKEEKTSCYEFIAKGARWKSTENWAVNPTNAIGLDSTYILNNFSQNIDKWESAAGDDILGNGSFDTETVVGDVNNLDNKNTVYFAEISDPSVIAVTYIWGVFGGAPKSRELVEWDQVYNTGFKWSSSGELDKMDFENIATHELGHSIGMGDLYTETCAEETMYGYASEGEIKKRDLNAGDVAGIQSLY